MFRSPKTRKTFNPGSGDTKAAEKIRAKLDEYDSMEDLPTLGGDKDDNVAASSSENSDRLDDLENNILQ